MIQCPHCQEKTISLKWYVLHSFKVTKCSNCGNLIKLNSFYFTLLVLYAFLVIPIFWDRIFNDHNYTLAAIVFFSWLFLIGIYINYDITKNF